MDELIVSGANAVLVALPLVWLFSHREEAPS
jgi:hypothetical protein